MKTIRIAVAIITDEARRMLVVRKRGTGVFMQPGGKIDAGETPLAALVRELEEEIGLKVDPAAAVYLARLSAPAAFETGAMVEAEVFRVVATASPAPRAEIEEIAWVDDRSGLALAELTREGVIPLLKTLKP